MTTVAFKITGGGGNRKHVSVVGYNMKPLEFLRETDHLIDSDEDGNSIPIEQHLWLDGGGDRELLTGNDIYAETGVINRDFDYDTIKVVELNDLYYFTQLEKDALKESVLNGECRDYEALFTIMNELDVLELCLETATFNGDPFQIDCETIEDAYRHIAKHGYFQITDEEELAESCKLLDCEPYRGVKVYQSGIGAGRMLFTCQIDVPDNEYYL